MKRTFSALAALGVLSLPAVAQNVVSARAGLVNYTEGAVSLRDQPVKLTAKQTYAEMKDNDIVRTALGRAEVLLSPGVVMRMAEESAVRLVSGSLTDTQVAVLEGDVFIEASELYEGSRVRVRLGDREAELMKAGLYRFTADPAEARVYDGRLQVASGDLSKPTLAKKGNVVSMSDGLVARKFDTDQGDVFYRWASRRSAYIAMANVSAAKMLHDNGSGRGLYGSYGYGSSFRGGWIYNPYFGMFTYIPYGGMMTSPFGYRYYSPSTVYAVYAPPPSIGGGGGMNAGGGFINRTPTYNSDYGYSTVGGRGVSSGASASVGASAPAAAATSGGARGGADGVGRGASAGGGRQQ